MTTILCIFFAFSGLLGTIISCLMREPKFLKFLSIVWTSFWISMIVYQFSGFKKTNTAFPAEYMDDRANFVQSITVLGESSDLINKTNGNSSETYTIPKVIEQQIYSKIEDGLAISKKVDNAFLDYIHPDLKYYYRDKLILGTELYYDGIKSNTNGYDSLGVRKQIEGINLMTEWVNWWNSHNKDLANNAYPND